MIKTDKEYLNELIYTHIDNKGYICNIEYNNIGKPYYFNVYIHNIKINKTIVEIYDYNELNYFIDFYKK